MIKVKHFMDEVESDDGKRMWVEPIGLTRDLLAAADQMLVPALTNMKDSQFLGPFLLSEKLVKNLPSGVQSLEGAWIQRFMTQMGEVISRTERMIFKSLGGLLDETDPKVGREICDLLDSEVKRKGLSYHNLRHRHSGVTHWVEFHLVFADHLTVGQAHGAATEIEASVARLLHPDGRVISHLEPKSAEHLEESWEER